LRTRETARVLSE